jgi:hypothetical protein
MGTLKTVLQAVSVALKARKVHSCVVGYVSRKCCCQHGARNYVPNGIYVCPMHVCPDFYDAVTLVER